MAWRALTPGCVHCVYDLYADDLKDYREEMDRLRPQLLAMKPPIAASEWDAALLGPHPSEEAATDGDDDADDVDPAMKAFMTLEKQLKGPKA